MQPAKACRTSKSAPFASVSAADLETRALDVAQAVDALPPRRGHQLRSRHQLPLERVFEELAVQHQHDGISLRDPVDLRM